MYAVVNGARIYFDVEGAGLIPHDREMREKEACFVLHGGPGMDHSYFKPWLAPLSEKMQLIYPDHRATGRSERVPLETCTIEQMADDIDALRRLLGLERVTVMGNSFGGFWALVYALRFPETLNRLILISTAPSHQFFEDATVQADRLATPLQKETMPTVFEGKITNEEEYREWWEIMLPLYFHNWDDKVGGEMIARGINNPLVAAYMFSNEIPKYDVRPRLGEITVPTLILAGRHDWVTPPTQAKQIAAGIPHAELVVFEESGHMPFIEEQQRFLDVVEGFLGRT